MEYEKCQKRYAMQSIQGCGLIKDWCHVTMALSLKEAVHMVDHCGEEWRIFDTKEQKVVRFTCPICKEAGINPFVCLRCKKTMILTFNSCAGCPYKQPAQICMICGESGAIFIRQMIHDMSG